MKMYEDESLKFAAMRSALKILEPSGWGGVGQRQTFIKIRHFSFFSLGPDGSRGLQDPSVDLRGTHGTQFRP